MAVRTGCLETGGGKIIFVVVFTSLVSNCCLPKHSCMNSLPFLSPPQIPSTRIVLFKSPHYSDTTAFAQSFWEEWMEEWTWPQKWGLIQLGAELLLFKLCCITGPGFKTCPINSGQNLGIWQLNQCLPSWLSWGLLTSVLNHVDIENGCQLFL